MRRRCLDPARADRLAIPFCGNVEGATKVRPPLPGACNSLLWECHAGHPAYPWGWLLAIPFCGNAGVVCRPVAGDVVPLAIPFCGNDVRVLREETEADVLAIPFCGNVHWFCVIAVLFLVFAGFHCVLCSACPSCGNAVSRRTRGGGLISV